MGHAIGPAELALRTCAMLTHFNEHGESWNPNLAGDDLYAKPGVKMMDLAEY